MGNGFKIGGRIPVAKLTKPSLSATRLTFNNSEQSISVVGFDAKYMDVTGSLSAKNAGNYTVTVSLKKHCKWTDGTKTNVVMSWKINPMTLTIPSASGNYTYDGATKSAVVTNFNSTWETQSGTASTTTRGQYTITWALKDKNNTTWSDGTTVNKSASWQINPRSVTIPSVSGNFTFDTATKTATVSNFNSTWINQSGTVSNSKYGTYTVAWALKDKNNTVWSNGTTTDKNGTWQINKRAITIPSVSGDYTFIDGTTRNASISNMDSKYVTQGGTASTTSFSSSAFTVTFNLKYPSDTYWSGSNDTSQKSGNWYVRWVNGTSHYSNDIFNMGWYRGTRVLMNSTYSNSTAYMDDSGRIVIDGSRTVRDSNYNYYAYAAFNDLSLSNSKICVQIDEYTPRTSTSYPDTGSGTYNCQLSATYLSNGIHYTNNFKFKGTGVFKYDFGKTLVRVDVENFGDYNGDYYVSYGVLFRVSRIWIE